MIIKTNKMKKTITIFGSALLLVAVVTLTASTQQDKNNKAKNEQQQNPGKSQDKPAKADKQNPAASKAKKDQASGKQVQQNNPGKNDMNPGKGRNDINPGKGRNDANSGNANNDMARGNKNNGKSAAQTGYYWDRENFKNRQKIKNQEKVTICHKFSGNEPAVTIRVSSHALKAHMGHGDIMGDCPAVQGSRFTDIFLRNRGDYYNTLYNSQEQVSYSRSILDYALARLTNSRQQLVYMQNNNYAPADIQRRETTVVELEQNVSLLETVLGVASTLIANKLQ
jgi:hypothetical protein